jgi:N-acyl homoserine lactone hydrolase
MGNILQTNDIQTAVYYCKGKELKVHAVQTGLISVKENFLERKGPGFLSKLNILLGSTYAGFMPIWVWVIEHPEGVIVIDTGEIEESAHKGFYRKESMGTKFNLKAMSSRRDIGKKDELDVQLARLGITPDRVSKVVMTHLHGDHTDGLKFFPGNEIIVNEAEHKKPYGNLPTTYPKWFSPNLVNFLKDKVDLFDVAYPLTKSEDLLLVPTPGHTHYHSSVLLRTDDEHILFAGDISYTSKQLLDYTFAGANVDYLASRKTYDNVSKYAKRHSLVYLPSHDGESAKRLVGKECLDVN